MSELRDLVEHAQKVAKERDDPLIEELATELEQAVTDLEEIQYFIGLARAIFINSAMQGDPAVEMEAILASVHEPMQLHRFVNRAKMIAIDDVLSRLSPGRITVLAETLEKERDKYAEESRKEKP